VTKVVLTHLQFIQAIESKMTLEDGGLQVDNSIVRSVAADGP